MTKPVVLMTGPFSEEDVAALERDYEIHKLWEQKDQAAFFAQHGPRIRAIATRAELGARPELLAQLPNVEMVSSFAWASMPLIFPPARRAASRCPTRRACSPKRWPILRLP